MFCRETGVCELGKEKAVPVVGSRLQPSGIFSSSSYLLETTGDYDERSWWGSASDLTPTDRPVRLKEVKMRMI
jgi:hypothetical protein